MKIALITRSTLFSTPGGDTVQVSQTAWHLNELGLTADIRLTNEPICYEEYDLLHFFNIIRPADILFHCEKARKPYVVSTIYVDYSEYDKNHRGGIGKIFKQLPANSNEYIKTIARWLLGKDKMISTKYLWTGQRKSIAGILKKASLILPNSLSEYNRIMQNYDHPAAYKIIPNGVDPGIFKSETCVQKDDHLVICVARIEGVKNQLNLIMALNDSPFKLLLIGSHAPNQAGYYRQCRNAAANNISFIEHMPQKELVTYYRRAKVHVLPSWFETTGLSSLEAALMGCNIVITDKGDTREYFENDACYCDPSQPESILRAVEKASSAPVNENLQQRILNKYTWKQAAVQTLNAYKTIAVA